MKIGIAIIAICVIVMAGLFARLVHNEKIDKKVNHELNELHGLTRTSKPIAQKCAINASGKHPPKKY